MILWRKLLAKSSEKQLSYVKMKREVALAEAMMHQAKVLDLDPTDPGIGLSLSDGRHRGVTAQVRSR